MPSLARVRVRVGVHDSTSIFDASTTQGWPERENKEIGVDFVEGDGGWGLFWVPLLGDGVGEGEAEGWVDIDEDLCALGSLEVREWEGVGVTFTDSPMGTIMLSRKRGSSCIFTKSQSSFLLCPPSLVFYSQIF